MQSVSSVSVQWNDGGRGSSSSLTGISLSLSPCCCCEFFGLSTCDVSCGDVEDLGLSSSVGLTYLSSDVDAGSAADVAYRLCWVVMLGSVGAQMVIFELPTFVGV